MKLGLDFLGIGVSGGEEGARHGPSIMAGGTPKAWERVEKILLDISAKFEGEPCAALVGPEGAGHFVKTIHNGIEYADMEMIAEIYGLMRDGFGMTPAAMADVFAKWNEGPLKSYLIEITGKVLSAADTKTASRWSRSSRIPPARRAPALGGDRSAGPRRPGDRDRGGRRRPQPVGRARPAPSPRRRSSAPRR